MRVACQVDRELRSLEGRHEIPRALGPSGGDGDVGSLAWPIRPGIPHCRTPYVRGSARPTAATFAWPIRPGIKFIDERPPPTGDGEVCRRVRGFFAEGWIEGGPGVGFCANRPPTPAEDQPVSPPPSEEAGRSIVIRRWRPRGAMARSAAGFADSSRTGWIEGLRLTRPAVESAPVAAGLLSECFQANPAWPVPSQDRLPLCRPGESPSRRGPDCRSPSP